MNVFCVCKQISFLTFIVHRTHFSMLCFTSGYFEILINNKSVNAFNPKC